MATLLKNLKLHINTDKWSFSAISLTDLQRKQQQKNNFFIQISHYILCQSTSCLAFKDNLLPFENI